MLLQSDLDQRIEQVLKLYLDKKGRLRRRDFEQGTEIYAAWIGEKTDPKQIRKTLKEIMQRNDWKPRRHGCCAANVGTIKFDRHIITKRCGFCWFKIYLWRDLRRMSGLRNMIANKKIKKLSLDVLQASSAVV